MKLKSSSNKKTYIFLVVLAIMIVLLLSFKNAITKKAFINYPETPYFEQKTTLNVIQLSINEKQYNKLRKKRDKALSVGILETKESDYVPATVTFNGVSYKAEVRLKGDWTDHLRGDKWSFRVKLKGDNTILGMRKFSIHHPKTRGYVNEWLYHKAIKKEKIMGLRYSFLEGAIHIKKEHPSSYFKKSDSLDYINKEVGLYALEESFDKRTIESNKGKESIILKFSEDYWWQEVKKATGAGMPYGLKSGNFMNSQLGLLSKYPITVFSEEKVLSDSTLLNYFKLSKNLLEDLRLGKTTIDKVFDVKKLAMQNAILNLFGAVHGTYSINLRFYYNPITSKLEPIAFDGNSGLKLKKYNHFIFLDHKRDSVYLKELACAIDKVSQPKYLNKLVKTHKKDLDYYQKVLYTEFKRRLFDEENLRYNQGILRKELIRLQENLNLSENAVENFNNAIKKIIILPSLGSWEKIRTNVKEDVKYKNYNTFNISRNSIVKPSYISIKNIDVNYGSNYRTSIIVKKGKTCNIFGLRIQGRYPNRVDAIFDLEKGIVIDEASSSDFKNEDASIVNLGDGWYKCSLSGEIYSEKIRVSLGSTTDKRNVNNWEGTTKNKCDINIVPSSLKLEEITR